MIEAKSVGISKTMFIYGLIVAILASSLISTMMIAQFPEFIGTEVDKGDTGPASTFAHWVLTWYTLTSDFHWGASIGTSEFPSTFAYDWENGTIFNGYGDYVGFEATMQVNMQRDGGGPVTFLLGADDSAVLLLDGSQILSANLQWGGIVTGGVGKSVTLSQGVHTLTLIYYEVGSLARVMFDCDSDILYRYA